MASSDCIVDKSPAMFVYVQVVKGGERGRRWVSRLISREWVASSDCIVDKSPAMFV